MNITTTRSLRQPEQSFGCFADCVFISGGRKNMFAVNDIVMYKQSGICKILDICEKKFGKETRQYYVLCPQDDPNTTIYCPIDAPSDIMRYLLTKDEVLQLIEEMPDEETAWIENDRLRKEKQAEILRERDHKRLIRMIKALYLKREEQQKAGKHFHTADEKAMEEAEKILYQEFAQVLDIAQDEVVPFIVGRLDKKI